MNIDRLFPKIKFPVLILSSKAGFGNHSVGLALKQRLSNRGIVYQFSIEELISTDLDKINFRRYKLICEKYPWLLKIIYSIPLNFYLRYLQERIFKNTKLMYLKEKIKSLNVKTIICTNHRSAFWTSSLKRRKEISVHIIAFITDHYIGPGWKFIFWSEVDNILGALYENAIPKYLANKFIKSELPVQKEYFNVANIKGNNNEVLITGGGWGLGPIFKVVELIHRHYKDLKLHVVCGTNTELFNKLKDRFEGNPMILIYGKVKSLAPIMKQCASVITKPGALSVTEAYKAKRKIYLLPGLPIIEEYNRIYMMKNFLAKDFLLDQFQDLVLK